MQTTSSVSLCGVLSGPDAFCTVSNPCGECLTFPYTVSVDNRRAWRNFWSVNGKLISCFVFLGGFLLKGFLVGIGFLLQNVETCFPADFLTFLR